MARLRPLAAAWLPVALWMVLILVLSGRSDFPSRQNPVTGETIRSTYSLAKAVHVVEYGVLGGLLFRAATAPSGGLAMLPIRAAVWSVIGATAFGAGDELRQSSVPNREPSLLDIALDGVSAAVTIAMLLAWRHFRPMRRLGAVRARHD